MRARDAGIFVLCAIATGGYWYIRNAIYTGNPAFPAELGPLAGPFLAADRSRTTLITWILRAPLDMAQWRYLLRAHVAWPVGLFILAAVGYVAGVCTCLLIRPAKRDSASAARFLLLAVGVVCILTYPLMPFSGTFASPDAPLAVVLRYVVLPFAIGLTLFAPLTDGGGRKVWWMLAAIAVAVSLFVLNRLAPLAGLAVVGIAAGFWWVVGSRVSLARLGGRHVMVLLLAVLAALAVSGPLLEGRQRVSMYDTGGAKRPVGQGWRAVERLPDGASIAWFGPTAYQYYPLYGRRLQFSPCPVNADGSAYEHLHERWLRHADGFRWWGGEREPELDDLLENLRRSGAEYVFVTKWQGDHWPPQQAVLAGSGQAHCEYDDGYSAIWRLEPER